MSTLAGMGELSPAALAQRVLTLPPFRHISPDDFRVLLRHLIEIDHIEWTAERGLIVGLAGERVVRNYRFYAVFPDNEEYLVRDETRSIGTIMMPPPPGERFALAGRTWETQTIEPKQKTVFVKQVKGKAGVSWHGSGAPIHTRVLKRMRRVLLEDTIYSYLQPGARQRLAEARQVARAAGLDRGIVFPLGGHTCCILPWIGSVECRTLDRYVRTLQGESLRVSAVGGLSPYYLTIHLDRGGGDPEILRRAIVSMADDEVEPDDLLREDEAPQLQKYDEFLPASLLRKAFAADYLDVYGLRATVSRW
jgi:ATP-dependent helicase Lhr and Lhr-like helicase